jgi:hypothetical protein
LILEVCADLVIRTRATLECNTPVVLARRTVDSARRQGEQKMERATEIETD